MSSSPDRSGRGEWEQEQEELPAFVDRLGSAKPGDLETFRQTEHAGTLQSAMTRLLNHSSAQAAQAIDPLAMTLGKRRVIVEGRGNRTQVRT